MIRRFIEWALYVIDYLVAYMRVAPEAYAPSVCSSLRNGVLALCWHCNPRNTLHGKFYALFTTFIVYAAVLGQCLRFDAHGNAHISMLLGDVGIIALLVHLVCVVLVVSGIVAWSFAAHTGEFIDMVRLLAISARLSAVTRHRLLVAIAGMICGYLVWQRLLLLGVPHIVSFGAGLATFAGCSVLGIWATSGRDTER